MTDGDVGRVVAWRDRDGILAELGHARGVVILPTDTVPGLHARIDRPQALVRLSSLKHRPVTQSYVVLCASSMEARSLAEDLSYQVRDYLDRLWPGPFSAILVAGSRLPAEVVAATGTVAVRVPGWAPLRELLRRTGPLASTSVNLTGEEPATDLEHAAGVFPDLPVWRVSEPTGPGEPSTLLDLTGARPRVLRAGPRPLPDWDAGT